MHFGTHFLFFASWLGAVQSLYCYNCTASLSSAVDESAQTAMRIFLESTYYLPPVHRYCALEDDIEFKTVPTIECPSQDQCVKISAHGKGQGKLTFKIGCLINVPGLQFVIRGCKSQIYKPNIGVYDVGCRSKESPSLCYCSENLCNKAGKINASVLFIGSFCFFLLICLLFK
ncbi:hypothetical protein M3Y97_00599400 [Aphelenchoides bicaudatus]|nr:hypothetical protein M3Y97_00599400 [Aphelenchoides bicaudatus]